LNSSQNPEVSTTKHTLTIKEVYDNLKDSKLGEEYFRDHPEDKKAILDHLKSGVPLENGFIQGITTLFCLQEVASERIEQVVIHQHTPEKDDKQSSELLQAAQAYFMLSLESTPYLETERAIAVSMWPFDKESFKPSTKIKNLTKAAALLLAHLEKEVRKELYGSQSQDSVRS